MTTQDKIQAQQVIININMMRKEIGVQPLTDIEWVLNNRTLEYLREEQDSLIRHYNQAINNSNE